MGRIALALALAFAGLGCGARSELAVADGEPFPLCGNAVIDEGEACDLGDGNEDRPALVLIQVDVERPVMPVTRDAIAVAFYDYRSESSHTGFEVVDGSRLFLYRNRATGGLSLMTHHGIDEDEDGITLDHGEVFLDITGLPDGAGILLADEPEDEVAVSGPGEVEARWEFWRNSDGAVLGPLPFPGDWTIRHDIQLLDGIESWTYVDADEARLPLLPSEQAILRAYATPSSCRTDCTVPACGDGIVDGGEVCDDGNVIDGDGCAADCRSL